MHMRLPLISLSEKQSVCTLIVAALLQIVAVAEWVRTLVGAQLAVRLLSTALILVWILWKFVAWNSKKHQMLVIFSEEAITAVVCALPLLGLLILFGVKPGEDIVREIAYWVVLDLVLVAILEVRLRARKVKL